MYYMSWIEIEMKKKINNFQVVFLIVTFYKKIVKLQDCYNKVSV